MDHNKNITNRIFKSCTLNRSTVGKEKFSFDGQVGNVISITEPESFEKGLDDFSKTIDGQFISKNYLKYYIEKTLSECINHPDADVNIRVKYFKKIIDNLDKQQEYRVVKQVFGGSIANSIQPISVGVMDFYEVPRHGSHIKLPFSDPFFSKNQPTKIVAEICVKALDSYKAIEMADTLFNTFELSIAFLLAEKNIEFSIGALTREFFPAEPPIIYTEGSLYGRSKDYYKSVQPLDLTKLNDLFPDKKDSTMMHFFNVVLSPGNEIERKLSRAIEWIGEAYRDKNRSSALLKVAIALEALFKVDERSVITASIMAGMAEQCAYISGKSVDECIEIERYVKELYALRSKIVHTGSSNLGENELMKSLAFSRSTIFNLLGLKINKEFKSMDELQKEIREGKYKASPLWQFSH